MVAIERYCEGTDKQGTLAFDGEVYTLIPDFPFTVLGDGFWSAHPLRSSTRVRRLACTIAGTETVERVENTWLETN